MKDLDRVRDVIRSMEKTLERLNAGYDYPSVFYRNIFVSWINELDEVRVNLALEDMVEYNQKNGLYEEEK